MKKYLLRSILLLSSATFFSSVFSQTDFSSFQWDQDEIICKEQERAAAHFAQPSSRNQYADQTDMHYQVMHWEIDPAVKFVRGAITYYFKSNINGLTQLILDLSDSLSVNSINRNGAPLSYTHATQLLTIDLGRILNENDRDSLTISYQGIP
ncbi:MAG: hypothetical protein ABIQ02_03115, partial [Saprospiraceae bacterium]